MVKVNNKLCLQRRVTRRGLDFPPIQPMTRVFLMRAVRTLIQVDLHYLRHVRAEFRHPLVIPLLNGQDEQA